MIKITKLILAKPNCIISTSIFWILEITFFYSSGAQTKFVKSIKYYYTYSLIHNSITLFCVQIMFWTAVENFETGCIWKQGWKEKPFQSHNVLGKTHNFFLVVNPLSLDLNGSKNNYNHNFFLSLGNGLKWIKIVSDKIVYNLFLLQYFFIYFPYEVLVIFKKSEWFSGPTTKIFFFNVCLPLATYYK